MKQTLIKITDDHYVLVDESSPIPGRDIVYSYVTNTIVTFTDPRHFSDGTYKKITHSTQPIETFNWMGNSEKGYDTIKPLSLQEIKELIGEVDVVELSKKTTKHQKFANGLHEEVVAQMFYRKGYNQAIEDNKDRKYTEEDLRNAYRHGTTVNHGTKEHFNSFIQSFQSKTEWEVTFDEQGKLRLV